MTNLLRPTWTGLDSFELRLLLDERIKGLGQYDSLGEDPNKFYLPLARELCRIALTFQGNRIVIIEPGPAFDPAEWEQISREIETSVLSGPMKVGREYSFSSFRVPGSWRGNASGVQILPPPDDAPCATIESADHPFILEFPIQESGIWRITNHRRQREHRRYTLLLNILLRGHTRAHPRRPEHFWADVPCEDGGSKIRWVQQFFFAQLGEPVIDQPSPPTGEQINEIEREAYYAMIGHDGKPLRVPADLDHSICLYQQLSPTDRAKFDRAAFWMDVASRQWIISVSSSFASLVSAAESLTGRGTSHQVYCQECKADRWHEMPGATERYLAFIERYSPGPSLRRGRSNVPSLRGGILHGGKLMQLDQDLAFGWDPPGWDERELHGELWSRTRIALRNWLRNPSNTAKEGGS
jgi:hypothetical protein